MSANVNEKLIEELVKEVLKSIDNNAPNNGLTFGTTEEKPEAGVSPRIERLKQTILSAVPEIEAERAVLITESYRETEDQPTIIRRARALEKILAGMTIVIRDEELIVGNQTCKPRSSPVFPEFSCKWLLDELDSLPKRTGDVFLVSDDTKATLRETLQCWDGKTNNEYAASLMPQSVKDAMNAGVFTVGNYFFNGVGHICVDYALSLIHI